MMNNVATAYYQINLRSNIKEQIHQFLDRLPDDPKGIALKVFPEYGMKLVNLADRFAVRDLYIFTPDRYRLIDYWDAFYMIFLDTCKQLHAGDEITKAGFTLYTDIRTYIQYKNL